MNVGRGFERVTWTVSIILVLVLIIAALNNAFTETWEWSTARIAGECKTIYIHENGIIGMLNVDRARLQLELDSQTADMRRLGFVPAEWKLCETGAVSAIDLVYIPRQSGPSQLYTAQEALQAEYLNSLSTQHKAVIKAAREHFNFPRPIQKRYRGEPWPQFALYFGLHVVVAFSIPWLVFFTVRWIVRGFRG